MTTMTRAEALAAGYTIDSGTRPVAYKGPRFNPTEWRDVPTEREEALHEQLVDAIVLCDRRNLARIERLRAALREIIDFDAYSVDARIARQVLARPRNRLAAPRGAAVGRRRCITPERPHQDPAPLGRQRCRARARGRCPGNAVVRRDRARLARRRR